jgi:hypothetical protein
MNKKEMGKKSRKQGKAFEDRVRNDLEKKGWIVSRWNNNVEFDSWDTDEVGYREIGKECESRDNVPTKRLAKLIPAKPKIRMSKLGPILMNMHTGFPDFIMYNPCEHRECIKDNGYIREERTWHTTNIGIEVKQTGKLDKLEKEKCKWLLENNIFSKILIASKGEKRGEIIYKEFK